MAGTAPAVAILPAMRARPAPVDWIRDRAMRAVGAFDARAGHPLLRWNFSRALGYKLNLDDPVSFNAKIQWRKIHDRNPLFPVLSDKIAARDHVAAVLGPEAEGLLPELLLATDNPDEIDLNQLPPGIAIKANHGCGWNILLPPGAVIDTETVRRICRSWLRLRYGQSNHEWAYSKVKPRILIERLFLNADGAFPDDLKFFMFGSHCALIGVLQGRHHEETRAYATPDWQPAPFTFRNLPKRPLPAKPAGFEVMLDIARRLGAGFDHLRVDFLCTATDFRIGELTIYHGNGLNPFSPTEFDFRFGEYWTLPEKRT